MSEAISLNPISVQRGDVSWTFVPAKLKKGKNSKDQPDKYALIPAEAKTPEEKQQFLQWVQNDQLYFLSKSRVRGMAINWSRSAVDDKTGMFNEVEFSKYAAEFSARGETIKSLLAEKEELTSRIIALSSDASIPMTEKIVQLNEIGSRLKEIEETIEFKKRTTKDDEDEEEEVDNTPSN